MSTMNCWQCQQPATQTGFWEWTETMAIEEMVGYEDDAEWVVVDRPCTVIAFCFRCGHCGFGFITDSIGIGLGSEESFGSKMEDDPRWRRIAPDPARTGEAP